MFVTNELGFMRYTRRLDEMQLSRLDERDVRPFEGSQEVWQLIRKAAKFSAQIYNKDQDPTQGIILEAKGDLKASSVCHAEANSRSLLIVAIRGTATLDDWMLNLNGTPQISTDLLHGNISWHKGFMRSAIAMQQQITEAISSLRKSHEGIESILFTGHSAGGAIAQIFYAMSFSQDARLSRALPGKVSAAFFRAIDLSLIGMSKIHCITFGAPPVANVPMHALAEPNVFFSIISEGDPVALAQEEYFKALISLYVSPGEMLATKYPDGFVVPSPILRVSDNCIVLRDRDPEDMDEDGVDAVEVSAQNVEKKLFGYPFVHQMRVYSARVEQLAARSLV